MSSVGEDFCTIEGGLSKVVQYRRHNGHGLSTADPIREVVEQDVSLVISYPCDIHHHAYTLPMLLGHVWGCKPQQRVAASTSRRYCFGLRLAVAQADAHPCLPVSLTVESI